MTLSITTLSIAETSVDVLLVNMLNVFMLDVANNHHICYKYKNHCIVLANTVAGAMVFVVEAETSNCAEIVTAWSKTLGTVLV